MMAALSMDDDGDFSNEADPVKSVHLPHLYFKLLFYTNLLNIATREYLIDCGIRD